MTADDLLWYVAYGSNLSSARLQRYLDQCPPAAPPLDRRPVRIPHRLFFADRSQRWGGGPAFLDPIHDADVVTYGAAWLIRPDQFAGILARENGRRSAVEVADEWRRLRPGETAHAVDGRYGLVVGCASPDDRPAFTFTTPRRPLPIETHPSTSYVATIATGLVEVHGLTEAEARTYLAERTVD